MSQAAVERPLIGELWHVVPHMRPALKRKSHKWDQPVTFPPTGDEEDGDKYSDSDTLYPVMPTVSIGGQLELIPMCAEGFGINELEGCRNPNDDGVKDDLHSLPTSEPSLPWNHHLLTSKSGKSLYRVYMTHDYTAQEFVSPRGLYNTRNMCFFNSVLQVLIHCSPFNALIKNIMLNVPLSTHDEQNPVLNALTRLFFLYDQEEGRRAISGEGLYEVICGQPQFHVERDRQEDSQEFLSDLLDVLETNFRQTSPTAEDQKDDLLSAKRELLAEASVLDNGWTEVGQKNRAVDTQHAGHQDLDNPIEELFGGRFKSVLVKQGGKPSVTTEPFQQIPVDISGPGIDNVQNAFANVFAEEHLVVGSVPAVKHLELDSLPPVLIVHLKRFTFIRHGDSFEFGKITKPIVIENALTLTCNGEGQVTYAPIGVIYHHGLSATRGHYTADVKVKNQWYSIDDEQVIPVQSSEVLGRDVLEGGGSRSAYMIFYEKLAHN